MAKYFYIIGTHDESDSVRIITRAGRREFALEFINKIKDGQEELYIFESNEDKNHNALEEFETIWFNEEKRKAFVKAELQNYEITPAITPKQEGEFKMDNNKIAQGLLLLATAATLIAEGFGAELSTTNEETKSADDIKIEDSKKAVAESKAKRTRTTKPKDEPKQTEIEEVAAEEEITTQEDDFGDFDFDGEEEKKVITIEEVRAACVSHAKKNTKEKTYAILKEFGAKSPNDLKKEQYEAVMAKLAV